PGERLAATTYKDDEVARTIWRDEIGLPPERMAQWGDVDAGDDHNFWRMADTGPCGPCSEIHFDRGEHLSEGPQCVPDHSEHCPAVTFLIADGVLPSNEGRGYVLRKLVRRAIRHGRLLGRQEPFMGEMASVVIEVMARAYPYLRDERQEILAAIRREEAQFA